MHTPYPGPFSRRKFLRGITLAGTAGLLGWHPRRAAAEPPPETTRIRLVRIPSICQAPQYVAEELLRNGRATRFVAKQFFGYILGSLTDAGNPYEPDPRRLWRWLRSGSP